MTYLIAQITLALLLAGLLGGALGWLVHRATHVRQTDQLRHALGRQQSKMGQLQSEVSMLTDDYDEMQRRSDGEIEALRQETQQIPFLKTNLEKSQLLVRQMLQKHEAKVRDLTTQNQKISARLKTIDDREQTYNQVQAELDNRKRLAKNMQQASATAEGTSPDTTAVDSLQAVSGNSGDTAILGTHSKIDDEDLVATIQAGSKSQSETDGSDGNTDKSQDSAGKAENEAETEAETPPVEIEADAAPVPDDQGQSAPLLSSTAAESVNDQTVRSSWASVPLDAFEQTIVADADDTIEQTLILSQAVSDEDTIDISGVEDDPFDEVMEVGDDLQRELGIENGGDPVLDGSIDRSNLFDAVEQRDDLKQIFGIGPLTEKALNELGITSYSQLADLKHHDIESIATVLQIVPGRIERDDWVGNARRQLEDVLEEL